MRKALGSFILFSLLGSLFALTAIGSSFMIALAIWLSAAIFAALIVIAIKLISE